MSLFVIIETWQVWVRVYFHNGAYDNWSRISELVDIFKRTECYPDEQSYEGFPKENKQMNLL
jgi:hypothetical protein